MRNPFFNFKKFSIRHDRCAMKVGTDGVLLGAYAACEDKRNILDIGSGSGLLPLMLAQRNIDSKICGIEIDKEAAEQSRENVAASPWSNRIKIYNCDYRDIDKHLDLGRFDLIVSNPPFFLSSLKCPNDSRNKARHADDFSFEEFLSFSAAHLEDNGELAVIFPSNGVELLERLGVGLGLFVVRKLEISPRESENYNRVILIFSKQKKDILIEKLSIRQYNSNEYTEEYLKLTKEFYLFA